MPAYVRLRDLSNRIAGNKIVVRRAKDGVMNSRLWTDRMRKLDSEVLMICDGKKKSVIAGITGW